MTLLHDAVIRAAARLPDALAVEGPDCRLTYRTLDRRAASIAALLAPAVARGDRVALWLNKSAMAVAAMQAVLRLAAAYVPIDPVGPERRAIEIMADCRVSAVVTTRERAARLRLAGWSGTCILAIEDCDTDHVDVPSVVRQAGRDDMAYILYTSGSTGRPKGICISHGNALAFIDWAVEILAPTAVDRLANHAPFHFDLSVLDLYVAFSVGASVHLVPDDIGMMPTALVEFIETRRITIWYSVPSALCLMMDHAALLQIRHPPKIILFAGEVFAPRPLKRLAEAFHGVRLLNLYGPTETNVCAYYEVTGMEGDRPAPIGRACSGDELLVVKDDGTPAGPGEEGSLLVSGPTVMLGYWGAAPHQAQHPYDTGDVVRVRANGLLEFVGRRDNQVKIRGYRVEIEEVESIVRQHPLVQNAAVVVSGIGLDARIVAHLVGAEPNRPSLIELKRYCADRLPRHAIPDKIRHHGDLPLTRNGKLDRRRLQGEM